MTSCYLGKDFKKREEKKEFKGKPGNEWNIELNALACMFPLSSTVPNNRNQYLVKWWWARGSIHSVIMMLWDFACFLVLLSFHTLLLLCGLACRRNQRILMLKETPVMTTIQVFNRWRKSGQWLNWLCQGHHAESGRAGWQLFCYVPLCSVCKTSLLLICPEVQLLEKCNHLVIYFFLEKHTFLEEFQVN